MTRRVWGCIAIAMVLAQGCTSTTTANRGRSRRPGNVAVAASTEGTGASASNESDAVAADASGSPSATGRSSQRDASAHGSIGSPGSGDGRPATRATNTCKTPVKLGVSYSSDLGPGLAAVGSPGTAADAANYAREQQALWQRGADDINSRGGFGGCKVVVVFHDFHVLNTGGFSSESQAECADLAEDKRVFAVVSAVLENETAVRCFADHRVVSLFYSAVYQPTPADFAKYRGYLYQPSGMTPYRFGPFIDQLAAADFLPRGAKVGILLADDGSGTNQYLVERLWKPRLAARGITPVVFTYKLVQSVSENSSIAAQFGSAVLRFKSANVDRILVTPDNGDATIFFTQVAESQGYHPRYALNSATAPAGWPSVPAGQRRDALNVSFSLVDLGGAPDGRELASNPASSGRARCEALYKGHTGSTTIIAAYNICDAFEFLRTALQNSTVVTPAALLAGVDRMVSSLSLANGYANATFRAPRRYDGASATRMMRWDEAASRWHYVSAPALVP